MKKTLLILWLFLVPVWVVAQNPDINLLKKLNVTQPVPAEQHVWMGVTNSVYFVPAVYAVSNLAYDLSSHDIRAMRYSLETAMCVGLSMTIGEMLKDIIKRHRQSATYF